MATVCSKTKPLRITTFNTRWTPMPINFHSIVANCEYVKTSTRRYYFFFLNRSLSLHVLFATENLSESFLNKNVNTLLCLSSNITEGQVAAFAWNSKLYGNNCARQLLTTIVYNEKLYKICRFRKNFFDTIKARRRISAYDH